MISASPKQKSVTHFPSIPCNSEQACDSGFTNQMHWRETLICNRERLDEASASGNSLSQENYSRGCFREGQAGLGGSGVPSQWALWAKMSMLNGSGNRWTSLVMTSRGIWTLFLDIVATSNLIFRLFDWEGWDLGSKTSLNWWWGYLWLLLIINGLSVRRHILNLHLLPANKKK